MRTASWMTSCRSRLRPYPGSPSWKLLVDVYQGRRALIQGIHDYEVEMIRYSAEAVAESRKQMNSADIIQCNWRDLPGRFRQK